jgi:hypothetical protein
MNRTSALLSTANNAKGELITISATFMAYLCLSSSLMNTSKQYDDTLLCIGDVVALKAKGLGNSEWFERGRLVMSVVGFDIGVDVCSASKQYIQVVEITHVQTTIV